MSDPKEQVLWHQSGVNLQGEPFIQLLLNDKIIAQMSPQQARDHAQAILESAEAAEQDAFILDWVINHIGGGPEQAAGLLAEFRKYRAEKTGKKGGPSNRRDWVYPSVQAQTADHSGQHPTDPEEKKE